MRRIFVILSIFTIILFGGCITINTSPQNDNTHMPKTETKLNYK